MVPRGGWNTSKLKIRKTNTSKHIRQITEQQISTAETKTFEARIGPRKKTEQIFIKILNTKISKILNFQNFPKKLKKFPKITQKIRILCSKDTTFEKTTNFIRA